MIINCGPTRAERAIRRWNERSRRYTQWHRVWVWWPIRISPTECVWMQWIQRKGREVTYGYNRDKQGFIWEYQNREPLQ
jgi:hypothetical protein